MEPSDFIRFEYILDGVTTELATYADDFTTATFPLTGIPDGSTLQLQVVTLTNANGERMGFDDLYVYGVPVAVAAASTNDVEETTCPEDLTGDGFVAVDDILLMLAGYGCTGADCDTDLNGDNVVGITDVLEMLGAFSTACD